MAPHSSTLAWKIPWMEEPGGLQSMGLQRVRHDWATSLSLFTFMHWRRKWQPTPVFLPGESQERGAWWAAVYGVIQSRTWLKWLSSSSSRTLENSPTRLRTPQTQCFQILSKFPQCLFGLCLQNLKIKLASFSFLFLLPAWSFWCWWTIILCFLCSSQYDEWLSSFKAGQSTCVHCRWDCSQQESHRLAVTAFPSSRQQPLCQHLSEGKIDHCWWNLWATNLSIDMPLKGGGWGWREEIQILFFNPLGLNVCFIAVKIFERWSVPKKNTMGKGDTANWFP